jgi:hypothetical protein
MFSIRFRFIRENEEHCDGHDIISSSDDEDEEYRFCNNFFFIINHVQILKRYSKKYSKKFGFIISSYYLKKTKI